MRQKPKYQPLPTTHDVTSTLTGSTITHNFYGGGNIGKVSGNITSTLTDCTVGGNVFGAGFSATVPTVDVMPHEGFTVEPHYDGNSGAFTAGVYPESVTYTWKHTDTPLVNDQEPFEDDGDKHYVLTTVNFSELGLVTGNATLTVNGTTKVQGCVFGGSYGSSESGKEAAGTIYGNTKVNITGGEIMDNVYGGGNNAKVTGNTDVIIGE